MDLKDMAQTGKGKHKDKTLQDSSLGKKSPSSPPKARKTLEGRTVSGAQAVVGSLV